MISWTAMILIYNNLTTQTSWISLKAISKITCTKME